MGRLSDFVLKFERLRGDDEKRATKKSIIKTGETYKVPVYPKSKVAPEKPTYPKNYKSYATPKSKQGKAKVDKPAKKRS